MLSNFTVTLLTAALAAIPPAGAAPAEPGRGDGLYAGCTMSHLLKRDSASRLVKSMRPGIRRADVLSDPALVVHPDVP
jgi:hypothetical protein